MAWKDVPLDADLLLNVADAALRRDHSAVENCFRNDVGGVTRFPGLKSTFTTSQGRNYLFAYRGDMMAVTSQGQLWRIGKDGTKNNVTGVTLAGPRRPTHAITEDEIIFAKGAKLVRYAGAQTELLSADAPNGATHVVYIAGYVIANEPDSGRFYHSSPGQYRSWSALDVFTAESKSDHLNSIVVTPRNELLLGGDASIERWEPFPSGEQPFFRRGTSPEGLLAPYTLTTEAEGNFGVNQDGEFVQFLDQSSIDISDRVQSNLSAISDWTDAWSTKIQYGGEKWFLLQAPQAVNDYGTDGVTLVFDYKRKKWFQLYDWDEASGLPTRWPGWSYLKIWGRHFIGGDGVIFELLPSWRKNDTRTQRMRLLTAHYDEVGGQIEIQKSRLRLRRGLMVTGSAVTPKLFFRVNRDNNGFSGWVERSLGAAGQTHQLVEFGNLGIADTFQFEFLVTDDVPVDMVKLEIDRIVLEL